MAAPHFLLITFPSQGHINPGLQFAKYLVRCGAQVTFAMSISARRGLTKTKSTTLNGITLATFSDGYDDHAAFDPENDSVEEYMSKIEHRGSETLAELIVENANQGRPVNCLVYTCLIPWAAVVAREHHIQVAVLWIQPANVFDIYYYYFGEYHDIIRNINADPKCSIELPGLPLLTKRDLPSFLLDTNPHAFGYDTLKQQIAVINAESNPKILVNTFDALESQALNAIKGVKLMGVGPLIPSAFMDGKDPSDTSFGADLFQGSQDYLEWLDSKEENSVVYVSFGSISTLPKQQKKEIALGLMESGRTFLWVMREMDKINNEENDEKENVKAANEVEQKTEGIIVPWCSQIEVLSHRSVGCFLTHCGWNSSLESMVGGVPVVAFPQWTDQGTNAKLVSDVFKTGVRVTPNEEGIVDRNEIKRCLEEVMGGGEKAKEMRENAKKWKDSAKDAVSEGGSSYINIRTFLDDIQKGCHKEESSFV